MGNQKWNGKKVCGSFFRKSRNLRNYHYKRQNGRCKMCGVSMREARLEHTESVTLDHIVPLGKGGDHTFDNTQAICWSCNQWKNEVHDDPKENGLNQGGNDER